MAIRVYKPMTNGTRQRSVLTSEEITKTTIGVHNDPRHRKSID